MDDSLPRMDIKIRLGRGRNAPPGLQLLKVFTVKNAGGRRVPAALICYARLNPLHWRNVFNLEAYG